MNRPLHLLIALFACASLLVGFTGCDDSEESGTTDTTDTSGGDTAGDTSGTDTNTGDTSGTDTNTGDTTGTDTNTGDTGSTDTNTGDTGGTDTSMTDTSTTDTSTTDTSTTDMEDDMVQTGPCNPVDGSGCAMGEKCVVLSMAPYAGCTGAPDAGTGTAVGATCQVTMMGVDPCVPGAQCLSTDGMTSSCFQQCDTATNAGCPMGEACILRLSQDMPPFGACAEVPMTDCDPVAQTGCMANQACIAASDSGGNIINTCIPAGPQMHGQSCSQQDQTMLCAAGNLCVQFTDPNTMMMENLCAQYCDETQNGADCPGAAMGSCLDGVALGLTGEFENVGLCNP